MGYASSILAMSLLLLIFVGEGPRYSNYVSAQPVDNSQGQSCYSLRRFDGKPCNVSCYDEWRSLRYTGVLAADPSFWMYQKQTWFELSQGLALDLASTKCAQRFDNLIRFTAGRMGPVDAQNAYRSMCSRVCLESDNMHQNALDYSGCECMSLSTQPGSKSYRAPGDWCKHNTGRLLCDILGFCGVWECALDDFMCPRLEYNRRVIPYKGYGDNNSNEKNHPRPPTRGGAGVDDGDSVRSTTSSRMRSPYIKLSNNKVGTAYKGLFLS